MKRINSGKLRAVGYDRKQRTLRVELDDGSAVEYTGVGEEIWRQLSTSASAWSYYRDVVEEEFAGRRAAAAPAAAAGKQSNPLDALFGK